jgi:hypothetical protein
MTEGYIYCLSNPDMPGILKIGVTKNTPDAVLYEANSSNAWSPPSPYKLEIAKKVSNIQHKESTLRQLLLQSTKRITSKPDFFRVSLQEVNTLFDLMDGKIWSETHRADQQNVDLAKRQTQAYYRSIFNATT